MSRASKRGANKNGWWPGEATRQDHISANFACNSVGESTRASKWTRTQAEYFNLMGTSFQTGSAVTSFKQASGCDKRNDRAQSEPLKRSPHNQVTDPELSWLQLSSGCALLVRLPTDRSTATSTSLGTPCPAKYWGMPAMSLAGPYTEPNSHPTADKLVPRRWERLTWTHSGARGREATEAINDTPARLPGGRPEWLGKHAGGLQSSSYPSYPTIGGYRSRSTAGKVGQTAPSF